jgi:hypothetical protein
MLFIHRQLNSFLNLGICKEAPNMARSKSITGTTTPRKKDDGKTANQEQTLATNPVAPTLKNSDAAKPEIRGKNVVPISLVPPVAVPPSVLPTNIDDEIRRRAYELFLKRGTASGSAAQDWITAEKEVLQRYHRQSA